MNGLEKPEELGQVHRTEFTDIPPNPEAPFDKETGHLKDKYIDVYIKFGKGERDMDTVQAEKIHQHLMECKDCMARKIGMVKKTDDNKLPF